MTPSLLKRLEKRFSITAKEILEGYIPNIDCYTVGDPIYFFGDTELGCLRLFYINKRGTVTFSINLGKWVYTYYMG